MGIQGGGLANEEEKRAENAPNAPNAPEHSKKFKKLVKRLGVLGYKTNNQNVPQSETWANGPVRSGNIEGFVWRPSNVVFPVEMKKQPNMLELNGLHDFNIFKVAQIELIQRDIHGERQIGPVDQMLQPIVEQDFVPTPFNAEAVDVDSPKQVARMLQHGYNTRCNIHGKDPKSQQLYTRDPNDLNAKYLGSQPASKITFLTFNMLDQGLAGEGGGFRTNWDTEHEDSDEPDKHYQEFIDTPHVVDDQSGRVIPEESVKTSTCSLLDTSEHSLSSSNKILILLLFKNVTVPH